MRILPNPQDIELMIAKFLINLPPYQLSDQRIWIHLQKMFHYFIDQVVDLQPLNDFQQQDKQMREFFTLVVQKLPSFIKLQTNKIIKMINDGYSATPVYGVIILNLDQTKILLVQSHKPAGMYGLPKGKINQNQTPIQCASREVKQEVGINVQLSEQHKLEIFYSKSCCFYLCKMEQSNINVQFNKNTSAEKDKGKKKISKEIKSLVWLDLTNPFQLKLNVATKKVIDRLRSQKAINPHLNNGISHNGYFKTTSINTKQSRLSIQSSERSQKLQKCRYRQVQSSNRPQKGMSYKNTGSKEWSLRCPFDCYEIKNRKIYEKIFNENIQ